MEKVNIMVDYGAPIRQAMIKKVSAAEDALKRNRANVAADNQAGLRINWFANNFKPKFKGI